MRSDACAVPLLHYLRLRIGDPGAIDAAGPSSPTAENDSVHIPLDISVHILWDNILIEAYVPETKNHMMQSLALTIHADHAYFYSDRKTNDLIAKLPLQLPKTKPDTRVAITNREKHQMHLNGML